MPDKWRAPGGSFTGVVDLVRMKAYACPAPGDARRALSEMFGYVGDLRSQTSGRASYSMQYDSHAEVPRHLTEAIIATA